MNHDRDNSHDQDPIWDLLRQSTPRQAGPRFVDDTVRAARLAGTTEPWWKRLGLPLAFGSLATAATAVVVGFILVSHPAPVAEPAVTQAPAEESLESLDDYVLNQAVSFAAENPGDFTDAELVSLISY